ncbi:MAG: NusG domain II-containing protein [Oscillospiraceae bacterium]|nr:NusG domain II-containing protein [Oscillospiraceae bacterium]MCL2227904.1 NusG domain II-containing protein [Oscillospiraceae bacterium]
MRSNKFWIVLLCIVTLASGIATLFTLQPVVSRARIYHDGVLIEELDIASRTETYSLTIYSGSGFNVIEASLGRVRVAEANCPDGICVRKGWISDSTVPIVCLPHRLVIRMICMGEPAVDAVVR